MLTNILICICAIIHRACSTVQTEAPEGWTVQDETCGDTKQLFEGWLPSNKATAESFVALCLSTDFPQDEVSNKTADRDLAGKGKKKMMKKSPAKEVKQSEGQK